jgi:hypothetical protein
MSKFMAIHTLTPGAINRQQMDQLAQAGQQDPVVHGYRSFANLSEGKAVCIMEAPRKEDVAAWFEKMHVPCDSITRLEWEGEGGMLKAA